MKLVVGLLAAAILISSCTFGSGPALETLSPQPEERDMTEALARNVLPETDPFALARAVRGRRGEPGALAPVRLVSAEEPIGTVRDFWTYDWNARRNVRTRATLRFQGVRANWWIADDVTAEMDALRITAARFDQIYDRNRSLYGSEWSPGIDGDPRVAVLYARIPGSAAGYFNGADELPRWVNEFSAEREMLYVNALAARLASSEIYSVLAHEHCHMIQFNKRAGAATWFAEGYAQLCERANGFGSGFEQLFLQLPDTQLNDWPALGEGSDVHYGAAYLFLEFLRQRAGGEELINALLGEGIETLEELDAVLQRRGQPTLRELFADFVVANALIGSSAAGRYAYAPVQQARPLRPATPSVRDRLSGGGELDASVHQWAARYLQLPSGTHRLSFEGARDVRLIPTDPRSGSTFWWSDRADGLDSTLTRTFDLTAVPRATFSFWTWYDLEADFDYAYVLVSEDGERWTTLPVPGSTTIDPNGGNLGHGLTGAAGGATWVRREVDLGTYVGRQVQLRFQAVTDDAVNRDGFAVDDVEIAEIGFRDDAEGEQGWEARGFLRSTNVVRQPYLVQLIRFLGGEPIVERHLVEDGTLTIDVDSTTDRQPPVLAVSGLAPRTSQAAPFSLSLAPR